MDFDHKPLVNRHLYLQYTLHILTKSYEIYDHHYLICGFHSSIHNTGERKTLIYNHWCIEGVCQIGQFTDGVKYANGDTA